MKVNLGTITEVTVSRVQQLARDVEKAFLKAINPGDIAGVTVLGIRATRATADQSITSDTTLASATNMSFPIAANEEWVADFVLDVGAALKTTGMKLAVTVPSGATLNVNAHVGIDHFGGFAQSNVCVIRTTTGGAALDFTTAYLANTDIAQARVSVWVLNGATAGTVQLQIAQSTSSVTALVIRKGSHMLANRIS